MEPNQQPSQEPQQQPNPPVQPQQPPLQPQTEPQQQPGQQQPLPGQQMQQPQQKKTNTFAIVGLVLAFVAPFFGFIVSIIALVQTKKRNEGGSGLAIAGIVISIFSFIITLGIIFSLVLNTVDGVEGRARDTERKTDLNAIHTQLEVYYLENGGYPESVNSNILPFASADVFIDPNGITINSGDYTYTPASCDLGACRSYILTSDLEADTIPYSKNSLNSF